jgi:predicted MFS family arabinose efflux permease
MDGAKDSQSFRRSLVEALSTGELRRIQLAWAATSIGGWIFFILLSVYAYEEGGTAAVGVAALARMLPAGIVAPFGGVLVDRHSRRDVLLVIALGRALLLTGAGLAVALDAPLALVLVLSAVFTGLQTAHRPAQAALLPGLTQTPRQLAASNAVSTAVDNVGFLAGAMLGGAMIAATSLGSAFAITAGVFAAAVWPLARIPRDPIPPHRDHEDEEGVLEELAWGFATVIREPSLRLLVAMLSASSFVLGAVDVLVVIVTLELLDLGNASVGWLNSAWGVGGLVGSAAAISMLGRGRLARGIASGFFMIGLPLLLLAALPEVSVAVGVLLVLGVGYSLVETAGLTLLQRFTSDEVLGRAVAVVESSYWITNGIGAILASAIVGLFGLQGALVAIGALLPLLAVLRWAGLARFEAGAPVPTDVFDAMRRLDIFAPLPLGMIENLALRAEEREVQAGEVVVRQGDRGTRFYIIAKGDFDVANAEGAFPPMGPGETFGEIALLRDVPRTAAVTARDDGLLYQLDRESFLNGLTGHRFSARAADRLASRREHAVPALEEAAAG